MPPILRPTSVTIISWLCIAVGVVGSMASTLEMTRDPYANQPPNRNDPQAMPAFVAAHGKHLSVFIVFQGAFFAGVFLLNGMGWARWLLLASCAAGLVRYNAVAGVDVASAAGCVLTALVGYFLFHRPAADYFRARASSAPPILVK